MINIKLDLSELEPAATTGVVTSSDDHETIGQTIATYSDMTLRQFAATEISLTLHWAVEIERSVTSICWHYPQLLGLVQRELDPKIHFTLPAHRLVLEAIDLVGQKCGATDWASVLECVCEIPGAYEECGDKEGLNSIFTDDNRYPQGLRTDLVEPILRDHIRFLKEAAVIRGIDPSKPLEHYAVGWGHLANNKLAAKSQHPSSTGKIQCSHCGKTSDLAGWREGDTIKLKSTRPGRRSA